MIPACTCPFWTIFVFGGLCALAGIAATIGLSRLIAIAGAQPGPAKETTHES